MREIENNQPRMNEEFSTKKYRKHRNEEREKGLVSGIYFKFFNSSRCIKEFKEKCRKNIWAIAPKTCNITSDLFKYIGMLHLTLFTLILTSNRCSFISQHNPNILLLIPLALSARESACKKN